MKPSPEYLLGFYDKDPELGLALEQLSRQRINMTDRQIILERSFGHIASMAELSYISESLGIDEGIY